MTVLENDFKYNCIELFKNGFQVQFKNFLRICHVLEMFITGLIEVKILYHRAN